MKWTSCSEFISGRSGKQCRERWFNTLNPSVKKGGWMAEEDFLIFKFFSEFGSKWSLIASKFPGRTENSVKNRFYSTLRRISLDEKKIMLNEKKNNNNNFGNNLNINFIEKNLEMNLGANCNNDVYNNNCLNNSAINNNDSLNASNPSSNLEELMKYLPQAFAEKTRIYLQYKKNEGQITENFNLNFENYQELEKIDLNTLIKKNNFENLSECKIEELKFTSKRTLSKKHFLVPEYTNDIKNLSTFETKNNSNYKNFSSVSKFLQNEELNNNYYGLDKNDINSAGEKNVNGSLLSKKRTRGEKEENVTLPNQINNTFNFNININNNGNCENLLLEPESNNSKKNTNDNNNNNKNNTENDYQSNLKKKKFETKKFPKIEELENLIQNFSETSSKSISCEYKGDGGTSKKLINPKKKDIKIIKNPLSKAKKLKKIEAENKSKASDYSFSESQNLKSSSNTGENSSLIKSAEGKEFIFKIPEICSNEEVKKLSLNLMQRTNCNTNTHSKNSNSIINNYNKNAYENYLYLENEKPMKAKKSNKSEKEEIFKFGALNNLYDQLNNLEDILLNTKKQLFNLDKFYYKESSTDSNCLSKSSPENNSFPVSKNLETISTNLNKLNNGINVIKKLSGIEKLNNIPLNCLKQKDAYLREIGTLTFTENKELKKNEVSKNNPNQESMLELPNIDKNALFLQDDLPYLNINEVSNIKIGNMINYLNINSNNSLDNLFNSNLLFNDYEGQILEEQEFPFMDNMFQI
jgi:hypothetical protein